MRTREFTILFLITMCFIAGCGNDDRSESFNSYDESYINDVGYEDGRYCAEVEYYNPNSGTRNSYSLDVEVEGGDLIVIYWPNGGWLDGTHFNPQDISSGECEFTSDRGYQYTVILGEYGGCSSTDEYRFKREVEGDLMSTSCPNCGFEKDAYDDYCQNCIAKIADEEENTCSGCGAYELGVYRGLCSSCISSEDE